MLALGQVPVGLSPLCGLTGGSDLCTLSLRDRDPSLGFQSDEVDSVWLGADVVRPAYLFHTTQRRSCKTDLDFFIHDKLLSASSSGFSGGQQRALWEEIAPKTTGYAIQQLENT